MNISWAKCLIDQFIQQGITYFCVAPGSRSAPLAIAIGEDPRAEVMIHFDERGLAFHAVGYAKGSGKPAVLLVTAGTAVGNLLPGIMEAFLTHTPLIVITADRPPELQQCGANQTTDQMKIFGSHVVWQTQIPCPDPALSGSYLASTVAQALYASRKGPVHLNCMFREPVLVPWPPISARPVSYALSEPTPSEECIRTWAKQLMETEKGVIVTGALPGPAPAIVKLAEILDWPILSDIQSRALGYPGDLMIQLQPSLKPDLILQFEGKLVSKRLFQWLEAPTYCQVTHGADPQDPLHRVTHRIESSSVSFAERLLPYLSPRKSWGEEWREIARQGEEKVSTFFQENPTLSEPGIIRDICQRLPKDWILYFANSMPVRDGDSFAFQTPDYVYSNRGLSGSDGNIATATGLAQGLKRPVFAILGDIAGLHDLNSLALLSKLSVPVVCFVINNSGGGVFSFLPIAEKKGIFEEYFATAHGWNFRSAAEMFHLPYFEEIPPLQELASCLVEVRTNRNENLNLHRELWNYVTQILVK